MKTLDLTPVTFPLPSAGEITVSLTWSRESYGLLGLLKRSVDLDLGCYYRLRDGRQMLIDGLQFGVDHVGERNKPSRQGCFTALPYIWHHGDDRDGSLQQGEIISINLRGRDAIDEIVVYAFIYEGAMRWHDTDARLTVAVPGSDPMQIDLMDLRTSEPFVAIASLKFTERDVVVTPLLTPHAGHIACDHAYGWGLDYADSVTK